MSIKHRFIYEIAHNVKEAQTLAISGYGYESKREAEKALASPEIDDYYRNKLKVFRLKTIEQDEN